MSATKSKFMLTSGAETWGTLIFPKVKWMCRPGLGGYLKRCCYITGSSAHRLLFPAPRRSAMSAERPRLTLQPGCCLCLPKPRPPPFNSATIRVETTGEAAETKPGRALNVPDRAESLDQRSSWGRREQVEQHQSNQSVSGGAHRLHSGRHVTAPPCPRS